MSDILDFLREEDVSENLIRGVEDFRVRYPVSEEYRDRVPEPQYYYYGKETWEMALAVLLAGRNLLLAGPKATGKNVLCENLAAAFVKGVRDLPGGVLRTEAARLPGIHLPVLCAALVQGIERYVGPDPAGAHQRHADAARGVLRPQGFEETVKGVL